MLDVVRVDHNKDRAPDGWCSGPFLFSTIAALVFGVFLAAKIITANHRGVVACRQDKKARVACHCCESLKLCRLIPRRLLAVRVSTRTRWRHAHSLTETDVHTKIPHRMLVSRHLKASTTHALTLTLWRSFRSRADVRLRLPCSSVALPLLLRPAWSFRTPVAYT